NPTILVPVPSAYLPFISRALSPMKRLLCGVVALGLLGGCIKQARAQYAYTPIFVPGAFNTIASGVNDSGQIAGFYVANSVAHGFLLSGAGLTTVDVPGFFNTLAYGINNAGQIVGYCDNANVSGQTPHGFLLSAGTFTTLDRPGSSFTQFYGIN